MNENGVNKLDRLINNCKYESRLKTLKKMVASANINFEQLIRDFCKFAEQNFSFDIETNEDSDAQSDPKFFATQQEKAKAKWWNAEWKSIHQKFSKFYTKLVINETENDDFHSFKMKYQEMVDLMFSEIKLQHHRFKDIYEVDLHLKNFKG